MSTAIQEAAVALEAVLKTVDGLRVHPLGANIDPPGIVVGPPELTWEGYGRGPTTATFTVFLMVALGDRSLEQLWQFVTPVADAVESLEDAVVRSANPGLYSSGTTDLPCYTLQVEMSLS